METTPQPDTTSNSSDVPDITGKFESALDGLMAGEINGAFLDLIVQGGIALLAIVVGYFGAKLVARWVSNAICKKVDQTMGRFAGKFAFYTVFLLVAMAVLQKAGVPVTSAAAILAAAGFAVGLAFQGTLSNFASGVLLLVFRPFKVGDVVNAAGITGKVNEIDLFTTTFDTPDNRRLIVPNSSIAGTTIENISFHQERRVDVVVGVAYSASMDSTRAVLIQAAERMGDRIIQGDGRGHQILVSTLGASSVDWTVRVWTAAENYWGVKEDLTVAVKEELDKAGVDIPFPQMELHLAANSSDLLGDQAVLPLPQAESTRNGRIRPRQRGENTAT